MLFKKIMDTSGSKPYKIWVNKGSEFYYRSMKSWLKDNGIEMYSTHNEGKSVIAERFVRTLKIKIYKCLTSVSKNVYIDKLDEIVNKYNNAYHRTIKMNIHILNLMKKVMTKILNLKLVIMLEYQNTKTFILQIGPKRFL